MWATGAAEGPPQRDGIFTSPPGATSIVRLTTQPPRTRVWKASIPLDA